MSREVKRTNEVVDELCERAGLPREDIRVVRSPLRVCPLGAHIDHQLGCVTGLTLDEAVLLAFRPCPGKIRVWSRDFEGCSEVDLSDIPAAAPGDWGNYVRGAATVMRQTYGIANGFEGVLSGPLPVGGLSSSAAVDVAYLLALQTANGLEVPGRDNIRLAQRIENDYIGLNNGILDQSIILETRPGALTHLDCLDTRFEHVTTPPLMRFDLVIAYSGLSRSLVSTDYNQRVAECRAAALELLKLAEVAHGDRPVLRNVPDEVFERHLEALPEPLRKRARHYHSEMGRVAAGVAAWREGEVATVGRLMTESGASSIGNYECGCPHTVALYEILNGVSGVYGSRFSGAGFRGSVVALAAPEARERIAVAVANEYPRRHPDIAATYSLHFCAPAGPAEVL